MLDPRIRTRSDITLLEASHVVVREGRQPCRIVLYQEGEKWIVHKECLTTGVPVDGTSCAFSHVSFSDGNYCSSLAEAEAKFEARAAGL